MKSVQRYKKKSAVLVTAVQLDLDTDGFSYRKWGGEQRCKPGDWLVCSMDDCYSVDRESFAETYSEVSPGRYRKSAQVWAEQTQKSGRVLSREGGTVYKPGDYIVHNKADGSDSYAVERAIFEHLYERIAE